MGRRLPIFIVGLALSITLRPIPITAQQNAGPQRGANPNQQQQNNPALQQPVPTPPPSGENPQQQTQTINQGAGSNNPPAATITIQNQGSSANITVQADRGGDSGDNNTTTNWWIMIFTFVLAVMATIQSGVLVFQAIAASRSAAAAKDANRIAVAVQRPMVTLENIQAIFQATKIVYVVRFANAGNTLARNVTFRIAPVVTDNPVIPSGAFDAAPQHGPYNIAPHGAVNLPMAVTLDADTIRNIKNGLLFFIIGSINYFDPITNTTINERFAARYITWEEPRPAIPDFWIMTAVPVGQDVRWN